MWFASRLALLSMSFPEDLHVALFFFLFSLFWLICSLPMLSLFINADQLQVNPEVIALKDSI